MYVGGIIEHFIKIQRENPLEKFFTPYLMFLWALGPSWTPHKNFLPPLFYNSYDIYLWHQDNRIIFIHTSLIFLKIHFHCRMFHNFSICKLFAFFSQISQFAVECSTILSKIPLSKVLLSKILLSKVPLSKVLLSKVQSTL